MGEPIKIILTAETEQAVAALRDFLNQTNQGLKQLSIGAKTAGQGIAGMSYYFRSGIDGIRLALAGGGARAGFYAIDEALRGVLASGASLSKIVPVVGALTAVAAAGYAVWHQYSAGERAAAKAAEDLKKELTGVEGLMTQIQKRRQAGLLGDATANELKQYLSGEIPLYADRASGQVTRSATSLQSGFTARTIPGNRDNPTVEVQERTTKEVANYKATYQEIQKYVQDILEVQGKLTPQQVDAIIKLRDLQKTVHAEALTQLDQEKLAIQNKYAEQRRQIELNLADSRKVLTPKQIKSAEDDINLSKANEAKEIKEKEYEVEKKHLEELDKLQTSILDRSISQNKTASATAQKTTDEEFKNKTISAEEWQTRSLSILARSIADEKAAALIKYDAERDLSKKLLALTTDPAEREQLRVKGIVGETEYHQKLNQIEAQSADDRLKINVELQNKLRLLQTEKVEDAQSSAREAEAIFRGTMELLEKKGSPNIFKDMGVAQNTYLASLRQEQTQLQKILDLMSEINKAAPGTFSEEQQQQLTTAIAQNGADQIKTAQETADAKVKIQTEEMSATASLLQSGAEAAKMFGKEGFIAWKAIATAQAIVSGALAVVNALAQVPYPANIFAAAAAAAAAAVQIATIESASAREHGGPVDQGMPYVVGEAGRELFIPDSSGRIISATDTARMFGRSTGNAVGSQASQVSVAVHFQDDPQRTMKAVRDDPGIHHIIVDVAKRNAHIIQPR